MKRKAVRELPILLAITGKSGKLIVLLKAMKFTKLLVTASSMVVSVLAYGLAFGPLFAVSLVGVLFVHEMGHVIALRRRGLSTPPPVFIPFLGAAIFLPNVGSRDTEAYVGYGGPLVGSLAAFACVAAWWATDSLLLLFLAFLGIYLNLFNMIPIRPLDGGRMTQVISPHLKYVGLAALISYTLYLRQPSLIIVWIFVLSEIPLPLWWRPLLAALLTTGMTWMFLYSPIEPVPWWIAAIDVALGLFFIAHFIHNDRDRAKHRRFVRETTDLCYRMALPVPPAPRDIDMATLDDRPYPALSVRVSWSAIYVISVGLLWWTMEYLLQQMPHH